ncbi:MAG: hypothetical protein M0Z91_03270 [Actinomycetota bacterium]|nr:hypothetical protein [Actinomycetota bacterium]
MTISGQVQGVRQNQPGLLEVCIGRLQFHFDPVELSGDALLLAFQKIDRDGARVVRIEQLLALRVEFHALCLHLGSFTDGCIPQSVEVLKDKVFHVVAQLGRESDGLVLVLDKFLNQFCRHRLALAVRDLARPARTNEVEVLRAPSVAGRGCHEPGAAGSAVDAAAQVMAVGALASPSGGVCRQQILHLLPGARVDERFMNPRIDRASVMNLPFVVGIAEQLV